MMNWITDVLSPVLEQHLYLQMIGPTYESDEDDHQCGVDVFADTSDNCPSNRSYVIREDCLARRRQEAERSYRRPRMLLLTDSLSGQYINLYHYFVQIKKRGCMINMLVLSRVS